MGVNNKQISIIISQVLISARKTNKTGKGTRMMPGEGSGGVAVLHGVASKVLSDKAAFEWIPEGSQGERGGLVGEDPSRQRDQIAQRPRGGHLRGPVCLAHLGDCEEASGAEVGRERRKVMGEKVRRARPGLGKLFL